MKENFFFIFYNREIEKNKNKKTIEKNMTR